ncbi:CRISPR-associated protein [Oceanisphaera profunda]|uniref:CRISPR-associated protein n=1 Tax=Oceanisphaera profunda TaxID=1416627 RepID=A0A1Y0D7B6_9GAMM|nr:TIGR02221 family CRISPR-associated protein [Oceanisphaera profunda]ART83443.1 CRISPR-associated protein [Oceanisphaera profunda]
MSTLLTFIGRGAANRTGGVGRYQALNYLLPDGQLTASVTYLGEALITRYQPQRLVVAGTSGSMWDQLLTQLSGQWSEDEQLALIESVDEKNVTPAQLTSLEQALMTSTGRQVSLVLLPDTATPAAQAEFIVTLCAAVKQGESLIIDVTHGFRFMPILALTCLQYLQYIKGVEIEEMLYGALDGDKGEVFSLNNVLQLSGWVRALGQFDHSGDFSVFGPLLKREGWDNDKINELLRAAFYERITNATKAAQSAQNVLRADFDGAMAELIQPQLNARLQWISETGRGARERALAHQYLQRHDYLRAVIYAQEGLISSHLYSEKADEHNFDARDEAKRTLADNAADFRLLSQLRNNLAHGVRSHNNHINKLLSDEATLQKELARLFKALKV